jgi:prepilin-type N-terminal cleavage/methylation domain-containing protein
VDGKGTVAQNGIDDVFCRQYETQKFAMKKSGQGGFSLVELLVGLALTAVLFQALFSLLSTSLLSCRSSVSRTVVHQSARMAMEAMSRDLRFASSVSSPTDGKTASSIRFQRPGVGGKMETLTFQLGLPSGTYRQTIYRIIAPGQPTPLTQNAVSELRFAFHAPRLVGIVLTVTDPETGVVDTMETTVTCVNLSD